MHAYCSYVNNTPLAPHGLHKTLPPPPKPSRHHRGAGLSVLCRAMPSSSVTDLDLYGLLGIESSSNQSRIKSAYRALQKRCHPDIAGAEGHDMAIVLNEAYSVLSDPISRSAYDKEQAKISEFRGYTGKPIYSVWRGPESEHRAVFVDEVKCVGCLKCALFASNTFAIESAYGRARVVAQWADPEHKILDAIQTCPVDCISFVERSNLAALEFLMSKQPRSSVRMTTGNTGGARSPSVFTEIAKFQRKFKEMNEKSSEKEMQEGDSRGDSRMSAVQGIRLMTEWLYWRSPAATAGTSSSKSPRSLVLQTTGRRKPEAQNPNIDKLRAAAAKMRAEGSSGSARRGSHDDEYWTPALILPPTSKSFKDSVAPSPVQPVTIRSATTNKEEGIGVDASVREDDPISTWVPMAIGLVSSMVVGLGGQHLGVGLEDHVGGKMAVEVVNSFEMQVVLAGITWYLCGAAAVGLMKVLASNMGFRRW